MSVCKRIFLILQMMLLLALLIQQCEPAPSDSNRSTVSGHIDDKSNIGKPDNKRHDATASSSRSIVDDNPESSPDKKKNSDNPSSNSSCPIKPNDNLPSENKAKRSSPETSSSAVGKVNEWRARDTLMRRQSENILKQDQRENDETIDDQDTTNTDDDSQYEEITDDNDGNDADSKFHTSVEVGTTANKDDNVATANGNPIKKHSLTRSDSTSSDSKSNSERNLPKNEKKTSPESSSIAVNTEKSNKDDRLVRKRDDEVDSELKNARKSQRNRSANDSKRDLDVPLNNEPAEILTDEVTESNHQIRPDVHRREDENERQSDSSSTALVNRQSDKTGKPVKKSKKNIHDNSESSSDDKKNAESSNTASKLSKSNSEQVVPSTVQKTNRKPAAIENHPNTDGQEVDINDGDELEMMTQDVNGGDDNLTDSTRGNSTDYDLAAFSSDNIENSHPVEEITNTSDDDDDNTVQKRQQGSLDKNKSFPKTETDVSTLIPTGKSKTAPTTTTPSSISRNNVNPVRRQQTRYRRPEMYRSKSNSAYRPNDSDDSNSYDENDAESTDELPTATSNINNGRNIRRATPYNRQQEPGRPLVSEPARRSDSGGRVAGRVAFRNGIPAPSRINNNTRPRNRDDYDGDVNDGDEGGFDFLGRLIGAGSRTVSGGMNLATDVTTNTARNVLNALWPSVGNGNKRRSVPQRKPDNRRASVRRYAPMRYSFSDDYDVNEEY